jgi:hypothetical protein
MKAIPLPPDEKMVQDALLSVLREHGSGPQEDGSISVRLVTDPLWPGVYTVTIAYQAAKTALPDVLGRMASNAEKHVLGVWVLNAAEARELCADASCDQ